MKIPADAIIAQEKLTAYLLAPKSRNDKSGYFAQGGFRKENWADLEAAIRQLIGAVNAIEDRTDEWGTFFIVTGKLQALLGDPLPVRLIWVRRADRRFSLVTIVPDRE